MTPNQVEALVGLAVVMYRKYVVPIDIPGVPNFMEDGVDEAIEMAMVAVLRKVLPALPV